jgi:hypothetical protein
VEEASALALCAPCVRLLVDGRIVCGIVIASGRSARLYHQTLPARRNLPASQTNPQPMRTTLLITCPLHLYCIFQTYPTHPHLPTHPHVCKRRPLNRQAPAPPTPTPRKTQRIYQQRGNGMEDRVYSARGNSARAYSFPPSPPPPPGYTPAGGVG